MAENKKNIVGFKKFTDLKTNSKVEEVDFSTPEKPESDSDKPMNPNLPKNKTKIERAASRDGILPINQDYATHPDSDELNDEIDLEDKKHESKVDFTGKVAKFPKNVKASKAYNFMENVKIGKKSIWYLMVERDDDELQLVKYNVKEGVDLNKFVNELKNYYLNKYKENSRICEGISKLNVDGNDKYSMIRGISPIEIDGRKLITKITEDLIKLLSR